MPQRYVPDLSVVTAALQEIPHDGSLLHAMKAAGGRGVKRLDVDPLKPRLNAYPRFEVVSENIRRALFGLLGTIGRQARQQGDQRATTIVEYGHMAPRFIPDVRQALAERLGVPSEIDLAESATLNALARDFYGWVEEQHHEQGHADDGGLTFRFDRRDVQVLPPAPPAIASRDRAGLVYRRS